jgi:hypothetical protein
MAQARLSRLVVLRRDHGDALAGCSDAAPFNSIMVTLKDAASLARRLQNEYGERFEETGAIVAIGAGPLDLSAEVLWGGRVGRGLYVRVPFASRRWPFDKARPIRDLETVEDQMRAHLKEWLETRPWRKAGSRS